MIRLQTEEHPHGLLCPVDKLAPPRQNPVQYVLHCLETGEPIAGPLSPELSRIGQQIVDSVRRRFRTASTRLSECRLSRGRAWFGMSEIESTTYGVAGVAVAKRVAAPDLSYQPPRPRTYRPNIGLIG
jgi:hypothetical protein